MLSTKKALADEMQKAEERIAALKDDTKPLAEAEQAGKELPGLETELAALEKEKEEYLLEARQDHHHDRGRDQGAGKTRWRGSLSIRR